MLKNLRVVSPEKLIQRVDYQQVKNKFTLNRLKTLGDQLSEACKTYEVRNTQRNEVRVNSIDVVLTQRCTLKCTDCSNLMQYYSKPAQIDTSVILKSLQALKSCFDYVHEFRIIGGEPLLNKEFGKIIDYISKNFNYGYIVVYTNGTIIPLRDIDDLYIKFVIQNL